MTPPHGAWWRGVGAVVLVAATLLSGCQAEAPGAGVRGTVTGLSDVEGLPDHAVDGVRLAAVPAAAVPELLAAVPADDLEEASGLPYLATRLSSEAATAAGGGVTDVRRGRFALDLPDGEYLLCLLRGERAQGCAWVEVPGSEELRITTGEAGMRAQ